MVNDFYDPLIWTAGRIAEEYGVSVSDILSMLIQANKNESLVRQVLAESMESPAAQAPYNPARPFDLVAHARIRLKSAMQ